MSPNYRCHLSPISTWYSPVYSSKESVICIDHAVMLGAAVCLCMMVNSSAPTSQSSFLCWLWFSSKTTAFPVWHQPEGSPAAAVPCSSFRLHSEGKFFTYKPFLNRFTYDMVVYLIVFHKTHFFNVDVLIILKVLSHLCIGSWNTCIYLL